MIIDTNSFGRFEGSLLECADQVCLSDGSIDALRSIGENLISLKEGR